MSGLDIVQQCSAPNTILRDVGIVVTQAGNYALDLPIGVLRAVGLDLFIRNRGAAAITVNFDGTGPITIDPGDVFVRNDHKYARINVIAAVLFDLVLAGVLITTLKREGWL